RPRWLLRHVEQPSEGSFVDQQVRGPWRTWRHEHHLEADGSGTAIRDSLELELPRRLERLAPVAESQVRRLLAFRARQLHDDLAFHARHAHVPRRTIAITGSSGLIGTPLAALLETGGHTVRRMVREPGGVPGGAPPRLPPPPPARRPPLPRPPRPRAPPHHRDHRLLRPDRHPARRPARDRRAHCAEDGARARGRPGRDLLEPEDRRAGPRG